jgi:hypothetical protein
MHSSLCHFHPRLLLFSFLAFTWIRLLCTLFALSLSSPAVTPSFSRFHLRLLLFHFLAFTSDQMSLSPPTVTLSLSRFYFRPNVAFTSDHYSSLSRFHFRLNGGFPFPSLSRSPSTVSHSLPTECQLRSGVLTECIWLSLSPCSFPLSLSPPTVVLSLSRF